MKVSQHAEQRCQMRGIPADCREILLRHGTPVPRPGGALAFYLSRNDQKAAVDDCRKLLKALERAGRSAIIVSDDGTCITAYKAIKPIQEKSGR